MEFEKLITERFSTRSFKGEHLSKCDVDKIIDAGFKAPTGCCYRPQRILVLNTDESIEKLRSCTRSHFNAPCVFVVCHNTEESWKRPYDGALSSPVDAAIVATHMMLEAENIGVGCCWVMHFNPTVLKETFNFPESVEPVALLVMGYPSDDVKPHDFHFKTRPVDEIVFHGSF